MKQELNLDTFGEMMDDVIHKSKMAMVVTKEADSDDWNVETSAGCGAVMDFYVGLNALRALYAKMLGEFEKFGQEFDTDMLAEEIGEMVAQTLKEAEDDDAEEEPGEPDGRGGRV